LLIDPENTDQLVAALDKASGSLSLREKLAEEAVLTIRSQWSFSQRMSKVAAVYDDVLGGSR
jgi:hypothetical protein